MTIKLKNKKAEIHFQDVTNIFIICCLSLLILSVLLNKLIGSEFREQSEDTNCFASIKAHQAFVQVTLDAEKEVKDRAGLLSYFINVDKTNIPPIECDTKMIKSKAKTAEDAKKELIKLAVETWHEFGEGTSMFYPNILQEPICHIRYVVRFNKDFEMKNWYKNLEDTRIGTIFPEYAIEEMSVLDYIKRDNDEINIAPFFYMADNFFSIIRYYHDEDIVKTADAAFEFWLESWAFLLLPNAQGARVALHVVTMQQDLEKLMEQTETGIQATLPNKIIKAGLNNNNNKDDYVYYGITFYEINLYTIHAKKVIITTMMITPLNEDIISNMNCEMTFEWEK